jgi:hypothetical protein
VSCPKFMCCNSWTSELGLDWTSDLLVEGRKWSPS